MSEEKGISVLIKDEGLLRELRSHEQKIWKLYSRSKEASYRLGEALREAHDTLAESGQERHFRRWLESIGLPVSSAYAYMRHVDDSDQLGLPDDVVLGQEVTKCLASSEAPKRLVNEAVKREQEGKPMTIKEVKEKLGGEVQEEPGPEQETEEVVEEEKTAEEWMESARKEIESFARRIVALSDEAPECPWLTEGRHAQKWDMFVGQLRTAATTVRSVKPAGLCPDCVGMGCDRCLETGWMPKVVLEST